MALEYERSLSQNFQFEAIPHLRRVLEAAKNDTEQTSGQLVSVYLVQYDSLKKEPPHRGEVLKMVRELQIPIVDFSQHLKETMNPQQYFPLGIGGGHYNAEGYDLLARHIIESVLIEK